MHRLTFACLSILLVVGCGSTNDDDPINEAGPDAGTEPDPQPDPDPEPEPEPQARGFVFVLGNQAERNEVIMLERQDDGSLSEIGAFPTGGLGNGGGLGSQSSLALTEDGSHLLAVNAGSDELSLMEIHSDRLSLTDIVSSGGVRPISVTTRGDRVYVVNASGSGSVAGFAMDEGRLRPIAGASAPLSSTTDPTGAAQVGLSPDGKLLVVTEKATNSIVTYVVAGDGSLGDPVVTASQGQTPFGFAFTDDGAIIVSEAFGGAAGASAASSYDPDTDGNLAVISSSIGSGQSAACWIEMAGFGTIAYSTNTASRTVSGYHVEVDGALTLFDDGGATASLGDGNAPIDMSLSSDQKNLYVLAAATDTIFSFTVEDDGSLTRIPADVSVPGSSVGMAAQ